MSKKSKTTLMVVGGILSIIVLCCGGVALYFYPPVFNSLNPNSIENKSRNFLSSISQNDYPAAFDLMTFELKDKVGIPEKLPNYIGFKSELISFSKYRSMGLDFKTKEMAQIWKIKFADNSDAYLWIVFKDEYHDWKIDRFELRK